MKSPPPTVKPDWARLSEVVGRALDLAKPEREKFLARVCRLADGSPDASLRVAATRLVEASERADEIDAFRSPVSGLAGVVADSEALHTSDMPRRIGPWKPAHRLGSGGMGVVYAAIRDDETFDQHAAVKLVHPGFAADFAERFVRERAVLAGLNHPGVARLLDGGRTMDGSPYLAMELVDGVPITRYAEGRKLSVRQRLRLFLQACDAVAYAHQNLVVHRDLKPAHVLVDDSVQYPRVKLLDFGIAKLLKGDDHSLTRTVGGHMTPAYAAPEQLLGESITTATDVYALGLVLFELLVGTRPYDLSNLTASETEHVVTLYSPPAPSLAVPDVAIARVLKGDLDQVIMKAMAKEPHRRYATAAALAEDIRRYLGGQPVVAQPDSFNYRLRRFVGRNRVAVVATSLAFVAITVLGTGFTMRLASERNRARLAAAEAHRNAERAEAVSDFLERVLRAPNDRWYVDGNAKGPETPISAVLAEANARIENDFVDRPDIRADLHHILGDTYMSLRMANETRTHHERALELRRELFEPPHPKLSEALYYAALVQPNEWQAMLLLREAVAMQRLRNEGNNFPFMVQTLVPLELLAGHASRADTLARLAYEYADLNFVDGTDAARYRPAMIWLASERAWALSTDGRLADADSWLARVDSLFTQFPHDEQTLHLWFQNQAVRGIHLAHARLRQDAEPILRSVADNDPAAINPPYGIPPDFEVDGGYRQWAAAYLVDLLEKVGRPVPARYRDLADQHRQRVESILSGIESRTAGN